MFLVGMENLRTALGGVSCLQVGIAVKKILYATDDNEDVMNEAQAMMNMDAEDMKENIGTDSGIMA